MSGYSQQQSMSSDAPWILGRSSGSVGGHKKVGDWIKVPSATGPPESLRERVWVGVGESHFWVPEYAPSRLEI